MTEQFKAKEICHRGQEIFGENNNSLGKFKFLVSTEWNTRFKFFYNFLFQNYDNICIAKFIIPQADPPKTANFSAPAMEQLAAILSFFEVII